MAKVQPGESFSQPATSPILAYESTITTSAPSTSRPLTSRIRQILLANPPPSDAANFRTALDALAQMYSAPSTETSKLSVGKGKSSSSTSSIAQPFTLIDTPRARRDISTDLRQRSLSAIDTIIDILADVDNHLVQLSDSINSMHASCDSISFKLTSAEQSSRYLIEHAEGLEKQRAAALAQEQVVKLFLTRFTLSDAERQSIYSREVRVGSDVFLAVDKLQRIRSECQVLLQGSETTSTGGGTRAGMDIMQSTSTDLDQAYQKLYKWCSFEFRQPVKEGLEVSPTLREACRRLKISRPDLLKTALTTLTQTRSSILASSFMSALTLGAGPPTYLPGPIELHAHDPIRYVGDMLAWIHQTVASEREFLTSLLDEKEGEGGRRIGQRRRGLEGSVDLTSSHPDSLALGAGEALVRDVLNSNLDGCCRPLKQRISQTLQSQEGSVTSYRLAHLVQFYRITMDKTIGSRATLSRTLKQLCDAAMMAFGETIERQSKGIERYDGMPERDLSLPTPLVATLATLKELLGEFSRSLAEDRFASSADGSNQSKAMEETGASLTKFDWVLGKLVDPLTDMIVRMADLLVTRRPRGKTEQMAKWEACIFICNCLESLLSALSAYSFTSSKSDELRQSLETRLGELSEMHSTKLLVQSGLAGVASAMETHDGARVLSSVSGAKEKEVEKGLEGFEKCLAQDDLLTPKDLGRLASPVARQKVHEFALEKLTHVYGRIVAAVLDETNGYRVDLVKRSRDEVAILLGF